MNTGKNSRVSASTRNKARPNEPIDQQEVTIVGQCAGEVEARGAEEVFD